MLPAVVVPLLNKATLRSFDNLLTKTAVNMKSLFTRFRAVFMPIIVLSTLLCSFSAKASHYAAVDLYVTYVGSGPADLRYMVVLQVYKACEPGNASLSTFDGNIGVTSSCGSLGANILLPNVAIDTLDKLCDTFSMQNSCRSPSSIYPGFVRWTFIDTLTLPTVCTDWTFSWNSCCRNNNINNITPVAGSIYVETIMNTVADYSNSTPRFLVDPLPYLCANQPGFYVNGPFDPNLDSMVTENVCPLNGAPANCFGYNAPYTLADPLGSSTGYTVNPATGTASFTPTTQGKYVLAFLCTEYDPTTKGFLSSIRRDVQVSVLPCNAPPPYIDSVPQNLSNAVYNTSGASAYVEACPGVPFSFDVNALSMAGTNAVYMSANNLSIAPGSTFTIINNGSGAPTGTFNWTPTGADIGSYTLIVFVKDSTCTSVQPIELTNYFVLQIKVLPGVDAGPDGNICGLQGSPWQFNITGPPNVSYQWSGFPMGTPTIGLSADTGATPSAYPPYNYTYIVYTNDINSACKNKDTVTVYIDTSNSVKTVPNSILICRPGYVQLDAEGVGAKPLVNLNCGVVPPVTCINPDSAEVRTQYAGGNQAPSPLYTPFSGDRRTARMQFLLSRNDLYAYGLRPGTITSLAFDVTTPSATVYENFSISMKCTDRKELTIASGGFEPGTIPVYTATGPIVPALGWNEFVLDQGYTWDSTKALIIEICYSNPAGGTPSQVNAVQTPTKQMMISYATTGSANICQNPTIASQTESYFFRPKIRIEYCAAPEADFQYTWYPGDFMSDSSVKSPLVYITESSTFTVYTRGRNGCLVRDDVTIAVPQNTYDVMPKDTAICAGESFTMLASNANSTVQWYFSNYTDASAIVNCTNCVDPKATPTESGTFYVEFSDQYQCKDTLAVGVTVLPLPNVSILNTDTLIKYGQNVQLLVTGAYLYNWTPVSSLSNPNIINPIAYPTEPTTYTVFGLADNGCRNQDSIRINIDYRDNLFVPSAFSPNGDGVNDIFRVSNLTFQKLQEFRVFNRWGQEIFTTNDPKIGWDGTWKGVAQDMGSYQYLIRVAYPDGFVETYKGDITLVR